MEPRSDGKEQRLSQTRERREQETDGEDSGKEGRSCEPSAWISAENTAMEKHHHERQQHGAERQGGFQDSFIKVIINEENVAPVSLRCFLRWSLHKH